jgi:hypothetical protein
MIIEYAGSSDTRWQGRELFEAKYGFDTEVQQEIDFGEHNGNRRAAFYGTVNYNEGGSSEFITFNFHLAARGSDLPQEALDEIREKIPSFLPDR